MRRNYFRLYFHYMYFNVARIFYLQIDNVFGYVSSRPTIVAGTITLGADEPDPERASSQVRSSFQYLVNSWTTIVELLSIYKRLRAFEATIHGERPAVDRPASSSPPAARRKARPAPDGPSGEFDILSVLFSDLGRPGIGVWEVADKRPYDLPLLGGRAVAAVGLNPPRRGTGEGRLWRMR